jgi:hypothetical protein
LAEVVDRVARKRGVLVDGGGYMATDKRSTHVGRERQDRN